MVKTLAYKKGFTLVEMSIVIAIILILSIPLYTLITNYSQSFVTLDTRLKEQYYLNTIMEDLEQRIRRADNGSINQQTNAVTFSYMDANTDGSKKQTLYCKYLIDPSDSLFKRGISTNNPPPVDVFPQGLEPGIIVDFSVSVSGNTCTVKLTSKSGVVLQKTIYLLNYSQ